MPEEEMPRVFLSLYAMKPVKYLLLFLFLQNLTSDVPMFP